MKTRGGVTGVKSIPWGGGERVGPKEKQIGELRKKRKEEERRWQVSHSRLDG